MLVNSHVSTWLLSVQMSYKLVLFKLFTGLLFKGYFEIIIILFLKSVCLCERQSDRGRQTSHLMSTHFMSLQMAAPARAGPGQSQEPGTQTHMCQLGSRGPNSWATFGSETPE